MFYYLEGNVAVLEPALAVIDCGGVGYALSITANTAARLKAGERARLYVHTVIREDCFDLYGFYTLAEKNSFGMLIGVSGVGPKAAQAILSANTPEALSLAILSGNEKALTLAPGIGKKIAQRVLLELKDKIGRESGFLPEDGSASGGSALPGRENGRLADAAAALAVLGYGHNEIAAALKGMDAQTLPVEELVRQALRKMVK